MIDPTRFVNDYRVDLTDNLQEKLEISEIEEVVVYTLVVVEGEGNKVRTNLKAPIIINTKSKKAGQIVLQDDYPTRHYLLDETEDKAEVTG